MNILFKCTFFVYLSIHDINSQKYAITRHWKWAGLTKQKTNKKRQKKDAHKVTIKISKKTYITVTFAFAVTFSYSSLIHDITKAVFLFIYWRRSFSKVLSFQKFTWKKIRLCQKHFLSQQGKPTQLSQKDIRDISIEFI